MRSGSCRLMSTLTVPAATSSSSIGSLTTSHTMRRKLRGLADAISFGPSSARRRAASSSVSPVSERMSFGRVGTSASSGR